MTTEHTFSERNDWQEPVVGQPSASETPSQPVVVDGATGAGQISPATTPSDETQVRTHQDDEVATSTSVPLQDAPAPSQPPEVQDGQPQWNEVVTSLYTFSAPLDEQEFPLPAPSEANRSERGEGDAIRPFTHFIEEFRQIEGRFGVVSHQQEETSFVPFVPDDEGIREVVASEAASNNAGLAIDDLPTNQDKSLQLEKSEEPASQSGSTISHLPEEITHGLAQPSLSAERPVSPLLRPATRIRLPRHGRHRMGEVVQATDLSLVEPTKPAVEQVEGETPILEAPTSDEPATRPARRYRFDRPSATNGANSTAAKTFAQPSSSHSPETGEKQSVPLITHAENGFSAEPVVSKADASESVVSEAKAPIEEVIQASPEVKAPITSPVERRRRSSHQERQREKDPVVTSPVAPSPEPVVTPLEVESTPEPALDGRIEDLPPLEYSELQAANSRRRRRRRAGSTSIGASNGLISPKLALADLVPPSASAAPPKTVAPILPPVVPVVPLAPPVALPTPVNPVSQAYNIVSGYTVNQMNQGNDMTGPFMGPEPSPARGSTFNSSPSLRPVRNEALRNVPATTKQASDPLMAPASVNYLANVVSQAIQTQTDRMVAELRRANQVPTNISVTLPPFPSNERVGVFVDVANLLYSARTLRMTVDFGKLLDFLRGNRRLVRAQAYCPTSPQATDDQMFLQAVKGLGYRITTKNYKTFSSGAKKADLDLDLCMDVVRLVDGGAVDCIVLVSGDSDFMPMLDYCSDHGVRVEVAAFDESMSATLRQSCDLFVNLSMLEEIRA